MVMTPSSFTYENLSSMKFKELQKLSVQFHVNKRWAKKQELVENLLALNKKEEEKEWRDGSTVFTDLQQNDNETDRRLTFNVSTKSNIDSHLTFEVPQNGKKLLDDSDNSRKTYDIPPNKSDLQEAVKDSRATFDVPNKNLIDDVDPRATFDIPQNNKKLLDEGEMINKKIKKSDSNLGKIKIDIKGKTDKENLETKTLRIPCARVTRRTRKDGETFKIDNTPIKMSKKSINIKKTTRLPVRKNDLIKSPALSSLKNSEKKSTVIQSLTKPQMGKTPQKKSPIRLDFNKKSEKTNDVNIKQILKKGVQKTGDEHNGLKVNFRTPPSSVNKTSKTMSFKKTPLRKETNIRQNTNGGPTPDKTEEDFERLQKCQETIGTVQKKKHHTITTVRNKSTSKPITMTKMPDFGKIHRKQFEQMDSLHDYIKKKEERIRKLFGTPQPGRQLQALNKSAPVFRFQSNTTEKENKGGNILNIMTTPSKKEINTKTAQKETFKNKLPSKVRTDIKDKNRSHIHGVRTNKRFELQMKFRNM